MKITFEELYAILEGCKTTGEWKRKHIKSYDYCQQNGMFDEICKNFNIERTQNPTKRKQNIKAFYEKHGKFPLARSKDPVEKKLGVLLMNYCSKTNSSYDLIFDKWARDNGYGNGNPTKNKQDIKDFHSKYGKFPSKSSKDPAEKKLGQGLKSYCGKTQEVYDPVFDQWARDNGYGQDTASLNKQNIKAFYEKCGKLPSQSSKDPVEKKMGQGLAGYCSKTNGAYDPIFDKWARDNGYGQHLKKNRKHNGKKAQSRIAV